jgi:hypothetical protein
MYKKTTPTDFSHKGQNAMGPMPEKTTRTQGIKSRRWKGNFQRQEMFREISHFSRLLHYL